MMTDIQKNQIENNMIKIYTNNNKNIKDNINNNNNNTKNIYKDNMKNMNNNNDFLMTHYMIFINHHSFNQKLLVLFYLLVKLSFLMCQL